MSTVVRLICLCPSFQKMTHHFLPHGSLRPTDLEKNQKPSVILLPASPVSFAHNFVSGMQSFYFSESKDAIVLKTCH